MQQDTKSATPSKREVAFRFVACTGIALALYYTPELRWEPAHPGAPTAKADDAPSLRLAKATTGSCAPRDNGDLFVDAVSKGN